MKKPLTQEALKLIACITMLIDHVGAVFFPHILWMRIVGRIAFPLYAFLIAEGVYHTRSPWRYCLRLGILMLVSEPLFDLLFFSRLTIEGQSVMVTLLLGCAMGFWMKNIASPTLRALPMIPFAATAALLQTDYGAVGVLIVGMFLMTRELPGRRFYQAMALAILNLMLPSFAIPMGHFQIPIQLFAVTAMIPICLYSEKKLFAAPAAKWLFNLFYPAHMAILLGICLFV